MSHVTRHTSHSTQHTAAAAAASCILHLACMLRVYLAEPRAQPIPPPCTLFPAKAPICVKGVLPKNSNLQRIFLSTFLKSSPLPLWNPKFLGARWLFQKSYGTISTKTFVFVRRIPKKKATKTQKPNPAPRMDQPTSWMDLYVGA
jgi:hypothetical protein